jgi:hypothetical protein
MRYIFVLFLSGCAFSAQLGTTTAVDSQARQSIAQMQQALQGFAQQVDQQIAAKTAPKKIEEKKK